MLSISFNKAHKHWKNVTENFTYGFHQMYPFFQNLVISQNTPVIYKYLMLLNDLIFVVILNSEDTTMG